MTTKISLSGTHGTGKTSATYQLARDIKYGYPQKRLDNLINFKSNNNVGMICEVARECPYQINEATSIKAQSWIFSAQLKKELDLEPKYETLIIDRPVFDCVAYTMRLDYKTGLSMLELAKRMASYDLILFLPLNGDYIEDDGFRSVDKGFQVEINNILLDIYNSISRDFNIYNYKTGMQLT